MAGRDPARGLVRMVVKGVQRNGVGWVADGASGGRDWEVIGERSWRGNGPAWQHTIRGTTSWWWGLRTSRPRRGSFYSPKRDPCGSSGRFGGRKGAVSRGGRRLGSPSRWQAFWKSAR